MKTKSINGFVGMTWLGVLLVLGLLAVHAVAATGGAVPLVVRLQPNADGTTTVRFQGAAGAGYRIESSDNLDSWTSLAESVTAQGDWTEWNDTRPAALAQRFYRVTDSSGVARTAMRAVDPNADSERLLTALAAGDNVTVIGLLRANGVSESTLITISNNLSLKPARVPLAEPFFRGAISVPLVGTATEVQSRLVRRRRRVTDGSSGWARMCRQAGRRGAIRSGRCSPPHPWGFWILRWATRTSSPSSSGMTVMRRGFIRWW